MKENIPMTIRMRALALGLGLVLTFELPAQEPVGVRSNAPTAAVVLNPKICVLESQPATKIVYRVDRVEFCIKNSFKPFHDFRSFCGLSDCDQCEKRTKKVLIKKTIPAPPVTKCLLKDAPLGARTEPIVGPAKK
jgi:hypothetical protein